MDILNQIREYTFKTAFSKGLLVGQKIVELDIPPGIINQFADRIIVDIEKIRLIENIADSEDELFRGFGYMFDKGVEISYFSRLRQNTKIEYNFGDLMNGISGDTFPIYIQQQVNPMIGIIAETLITTLSFIKQNDVRLKNDNIESKELMKLLLVGGAFLGVEFCLRIELTNEL